MNRKYLVVLCVLLSSLLLTACGKVQKTEEAIDAIGTVSLASREDIEYAESLFDALGRRQSKVENADVLKNARTEYDRMEQLVDAACTAITAIGDVTPDSAEAITAARTAWEALAPDDLTGSVQDLYPVLTDAETAYASQIQMLEEFSAIVSSIGAVKPDDGEGIQAAWNAYEALELAGLAEYANSSLEKLQTAEHTYNDQCELIANYIEAVNALERITLNSAEQIEELKTLYTRIQYYKITGFVADYHAIHETAENEYLSLLSTDFYNQMNTKYYRQEYIQVRQEIDLFLEDNPQAPNKVELLTLKGKCLVELARKEYNKGLTEAALEVLDGATAFEKTLAEYTRMVSQVEQRIASNRPYSGKILYNNLGGGYSKLEIDATLSGDACIKLVSVSDPEKYMLFYVRGGETAKVSVPEGSYILKYTTGSTWYSTEEKFGKTGTYKLAEDILEYEVTYSGNYVHYTTYTITLYAVWGGNLETTPISGDAF